MKGLLLLLLGISVVHQISATTIWHHKENLPGTARHRTTGFALGNKGYIGLGHYNSGPSGNVVFMDFWQYDPSTDSWTQVADFGGGLRYHCADFTYDGKAYVFGGRDDFSSLYNDLWMYDPEDNSWSAKAPLPSYERRASVGFTLGNYGVIGAGELQGAPTFYGKDFWFYSPLTDSWSPGPDLPGEERGSAAGFAMDNKGYVGTGQGLFGPLNDFYELKLFPVPAWTVRPVVGPLPRVESYGFGLNGKGYILTGGDFLGELNYGDMWEYDTTTFTWTQIMDFPGLARRYLDGFEIGTKAYVGMGTNGTNFKDLWEFDPSHALSVGETSKSIVTISQNAAEIGFHFSSLPETGTCILLFNGGGKLVFSESVVDLDHTVNIESFQSGVYIYAIRKDDVFTAYGKFIAGI